MDPTGISDEILTHVGLDAAPRGRVCVIGCGALAREILAILKANKMDHVDLQCLPAILHNHPEKITDAVATMIDEKSPEYERIFVAYADCGTGGMLERLCAEKGVEMIKGPHCYSFYEGNDAFAARDEVTSFYLTDFLARQFDAFVWKPLGLDRHPELLEMYFGHYEKLVYQAQVEDPALKRLAQSMAERMGLAFEYRVTGYGELETNLKSL